MATLSGAIEDKSCMFRLTVTAPSLEHPKSLYTVTFTCGDKSFHTDYDVPPPSVEVLSIYWVFRIAYIFQKATHLLTDTYNFGLGRGKWADKPLEAIQLQTTTGWLHVTLEPKIGPGHKKFSHILVQIFAQTDYEEQNSNYALTNFVRLQLLCLPEDAVEFGKKLQEECLIAEEAQDQIDNLEDTE